MPRPVKVFVVDDHEVYRAGLRALLGRRPDVLVVGEAGTAEEAVDRILVLDPDVVLMDLRLPGMDGLQATGLLKALDVRAGVVVVTALTAEQALRPALEAGARGFLCKSASPPELLEAIHEAAGGRTWLSPRAEALMEAEPAASADADDLHALGPRNREILALTAAGYSSKEIARRLHTTPGAVDTARSRAMERLGLPHRSDLVHFALRTELLKPL